MPTLAQASIFYFSQGCCSSFGLRPNNYDTSPALGTLAVLESSRHGVRILRTKFSLNELIVFVKPQTSRRESSPTFSKYALPKFSGCGTQARRHPNSEHLLQHSRELSRRSQRLFPYPTISHPMNTRCDLFSTPPSQPHPPNPAPLPKQARCLASENSSCLREDMLIMEDSTCTRYTPYSRRNAHSLEFRCAFSRAH